MITIGKSKTTSINGTPSLRAKDIADFLQLDLIGPDLSIHAPYSINNCESGGVIFSEESTPSLLEKISALPPCLVICQEELAVSMNGSRIVSGNPRLSFILMMERFFAPRREFAIHPTAIIDPTAKIGKNVSIGAYSWVGPMAQIGDDCVIHHHVVIDGKTHIGRATQIKSNSVIGQEGFNFCKDEDGIPHHFPHVGRIIIGDHVWIGACSSVERAVLEDTIIEDYVKIDDHVQVGHNTRIGRGSRIAAGAIICGRARVREDCWIGPNVNVIEAREIGKGSLLGIGANVITDVPENSVFAGNPARRLRSNSGAE
jgi:UDP-3-O-[3-hydroxymyristoyl] glucosamine N-acyltransferase